MNTKIIKALAKINLAIDVKSKREDGYHNIDMVSVPLKLHDILEITRLGKDYDTYLLCDDPTIICDENNLVYKAFNLLKNEYTIEGEYRIFLYKKIPVEAGLGGGSADAAAVLLALKEHIKNIDEHKFLKEASDIGADIPFCLYNRAARVEGKGEFITPIKIQFPYHVLIVKPQQGLETKQVYEAFDFIKEDIPHPNISKLIFALEKDDEEMMKQSMFNVLSVPAIKVLPVIGELLEEMEMMNLPLNGMSGTGSACFALSKNKEHLEKASKTFEKQGYQTYITQFVI